MSFHDNIKYVYDSNNKKVAVQMDIDTFQAIETQLEDFHLVEMMKENKDDEYIDLKEGIKILEKMNEESS